MSAYLKRFRSFILLLLCLALLEVPTLASEPNRGQLERAMSETRSAVLAGDFQKFLASVDPLNPQSKISEEQWQQFLGNDRARKLLLRGIPDLKNETAFLSLKTQTEWAAYYAETSLNDDNHQTLSVFVFRKGESGWRPAGKSYGLTKARPGSESAKQGYVAWTGREEMLKTIETDKSFLLEELMVSASEVGRGNNGNQQSE